MAVRRWVTELASAAWLAGCDQRELAALLNSQPAELTYSWWLNDFRDAYTACCLRRTEGIKRQGEQWDRRRKRNA